MNVLDIINTAIAEHRTRFAFELLPPLKGDGMGGVFAAIDRLIGFDPAYINVTFHREGIKQSVRPDGGIDWHVVRRRPGTVGISAAIQKKYGVEVVPHLICGGQSKYDIEDALIDLDFLGLHNVLALQGRQIAERKVLHAPPAGPFARRGPRAADRGHEPRRIRGRRGRGVPPLEILDRRGRLPRRARRVPASPEADIAALKAKIDAGAGYIVTQLFYDNARFFDFVRRCRKAGIAVPIIPGIKPLSTLRHLTLLPQTFGCRICPKSWNAKSCATGTDPKAIREVGTEWAVAQSRELKQPPECPYCTTTRWARPTISSR